MGLFHQTGSALMAKGGMTMTDDSLKNLIDHCAYLSARMRMFPKSHPKGIYWKRKLKQAERELERMMKKHGML